MPVPAIGLAFDQAGPLALPGSIDGPAHGLADGQDIHAIHHLAGHIVGAGPVGDIKLGRRASDGDRHPVQVVLHDVDHGQLPKACHVERLVEIAGAGSAVAKKAEDDAVCSLQLLRQTGARRHGYVAAHDAGRTQVAALHVGDVHGAAAPQAVPGLSAA